MFVRKTLVLGTLLLAGTVQAAPKYVFYFIGDGMGGQHEHGEEESVIPSYSIHYTKLYEAARTLLVHGPGRDPVRAFQLLEDALREDAEAVVATLRITSYNVCYTKLLRTSTRPVRWI